MRQAFLIGCSHVSGCEIEGFGITHNTPFGLANSFAAQLANKLGYESVNLGFPGASNDYIFRQLFELYRNNKIAKDDIVFLNWTGAERIELYDEQQNKWLNFSIGMSLTQAEHHDVHREFYKLYVKLLCDAPGQRAELNKVKNVMAANAFAEQNNIKVINHSSFQTAPHLGLEKNYKWMRPGSTYMDWAETTTYKKSAWYHYELGAHTEYADILYQDIKQRNLLDDAI